MTQVDSKKAQALAQLIQTVHQLRAPGGCPWDRAQTHQSLRQYLIEEAYEVLDVLDEVKDPSDLKTDRIRNAFREELGDLLMQVLLHSEMASEGGAFDIYDVAQALDEKLIRRHPHVFQKSDESSSVSTESGALETWEKQKAKEKAKHESILQGVPRGLPALQKAARILEKVTKVGFQWKDLEGPLEKVDEELQELKKEIQDLYEAERAEGAATSADQLEKVRQRVQAEFGDLLFTLCNLAFLLKLDPENALRGTLSRFDRRFRHVERSLKDLGKTPEQSTLSEMDVFWDEAKTIEKCEVWGLTGGIASGKSTVAKILSGFGIPVIDADLIARDLAQNDSEVLQAVKERFGTSDRPKLREIIFQDPQAKKDLEGILHPRIRAESQKQIRRLALKHKVVVYEAALLVETQKIFGVSSDFTGMIVVTAPREVRLKRLLSRPGITPEVANLILDAQLNETERNGSADILIENIGDLESLKAQVDKVRDARNW